MTGLRSVREIVFALIPAVLLLISAEVSSRFWLGAAFHGALATPVAIRALFGSSQEVIYDKPLIRFDPELGYACIPGIHHISVRNGLRSRDFVATIGGDGLRVTTSKVVDPKLPQVWILGCSFTWGYLLNDNETFPWLVQTALPHVQVRNFGCNGCGTIQQYLYLKSSYARGEASPKIAVFVYNPFHLERNTLGPPVISMFRLYRDQLSDAGYPAATITATGELSIHSVGVFSSQAEGIPALSPAEQITLGKAILTQIKFLCAKQNIHPVFAIQSGNQSDEVARYAEEVGFEVIDISVPIQSEEFSFLPLDPHPNAVAARLYAERLLPRLEADLIRPGSEGR